MPSRVAYLEDANRTLLAERDAARHDAATLRETLRVANAIIGSLRDELERVVDPSDIEGPAR